MLLWYNKKKREREKKHICKNQATKVIFSFNKVKYLHWFRTPIMTEQIKPYFWNLHLKNVSWVKETSVEKVVVFKAKIWSMQRQKKKKAKKRKKKDHSDVLWSQAEWAARPVVSNSCAPNNKWCIHKPREQRLWICTRTDERLTFLLFHSQGVKKRLDSVRGTGCLFSCGKMVSKRVQIKRPKYHLSSSNKSWAWW